MVDKAKRVQSSCSLCDRETWHSIMFSHKIGENEEYHASIFYEVIQCCGCETISFRRRYVDYEMAYPLDNSDEWYVPEEINNYPSILQGHKELEYVWHLPKEVKAIYLQSLQAMKDNSNILAGIGLRATIEAICNERNIAKGTLEKRIDKLASQGFISKKDAERLHAIRFLGNDAAHEIKISSQSNLLIALRIIEHLLVNIYILDGQVDGSLESIIRTEELFLEVLNQKLTNFQAGEEIPLAKIFGKDVRRLHGYLQVHEQFLLREIQAGIYTTLSVGKVDNYAGSKNKIQHYIVVV